MKKDYLIYVVITCIGAIFTSCKKEITIQEPLVDNLVVLPSPYVFDVKGQAKYELTYFDKLKGANSHGEEIRVNNKYVEKGGKPWIPVYGEFHFSRYPQEYWEDAILKMKASGMNTISSYIIWNHHEEIEDQFDWTGRRDLRKFIGLCAKHEMFFFPRIGPWSHAEVRYGGHPDWLMEQNTPKTMRSTYPEYIVPTEDFYKEIAEQMKGFYWKDGGPIYAIQLDNENWEHGDRKGGEFMVELKRLALKYGMIAPIYTCTGWANAEFPQGEMIPTFGSYADYFWSVADTVFRSPSFSFSKIRADGQIGTDMGLKQVEDKSHELNPYFTCETGIGMNMAYHRRTKITPEDNAAVSLVEIGNGCNSVGYFIFHGGRNPMGKQSRLNEALENGFNDNSVFSNDFQAAVGEYGQVRESFYELAKQYGFMDDFGDLLAPMEPLVPQELDDDPYDSKLLQRSVRVKENSGFVFVNNHIKFDTIHQFDKVQFELKLPGETLKVPYKPITVDKGDYFIWPFNMPVAGIKLKYATAQPFRKLDNTLFFFPPTKLAATYVFDNTTIESVTGQEFQKTIDGERLILTVSNPGTNAMITITTKGGKQFNLITLTKAQAGRSYKYKNHVYVSEEAEVVLVNQDSLEVISTAVQNQLKVYPPTDINTLEGKKDGVFQSYAINFVEKTIPLTVKEIQNGKDVKPPHRFVGKNVRLGVPEDQYFDQGTIVELSLDPEVIDAFYDIRLTVDYKASVGRFFVNEEFIADNYYNGDVWELSLDQLLPKTNRGAKMRLKFLALHKDDPVYIAGNYWPSISPETPTLDINKIKAVPVYRKKLLLPE